MRRMMIVLVALGVIPVSSPAQFLLQQSVVGSDTGWMADQGTSVAVSGDGNTLIEGGSIDKEGEHGISVGASWIFTRSAGTWTQQGKKLVGSGGVGVQRQGSAVSISSDGNTAIVGGPYDNSRAGAVWFFTRSDTTWTQQGEKLVGSGAIDPASEGSSVALSSDGRTAIVGGPGDNGGIGAAWVFVNTCDGWTQQGPKLVGSDLGSSPSVKFGCSVALSADGNTAVVGGSGDDSSAGAAWVFVRTCGTWSQQGAKLVGTGADNGAGGLGRASQGSAVSISADGNTALVGGPGDNSGNGASWVFTRGNGVWTQQGEKLVASGMVGPAAQGCSVSLSADAHTAIVGGEGDYLDDGAVWVFTRSDGVWSQQGEKLRDGHYREHFGNSVSLSSDGHTAVIGAEWTITGPSGSVGRTYIYYDNPAATATVEITSGSGSAYSFPGTGVSLQFSSPNSGDVSLTVDRYNASPMGDVSGLGLSHLADVYWPITVNKGTIDGTFNLTLDLTGLAGITDYSTLHLLKRSYASYPWMDAGTPSDISGSPGAVTWSGLTSFSQFALGSAEDNPLPIQLNCFSATVLRNSNVRLDWSTLSELNNFGFEVQRRGEGQDFQTLPRGFVPGHGTTSQKESYSYTDVTATRGSWSYRLKQIDLDGTSRFSETIHPELMSGVPEDVLPTEFSLAQNYPNPFNPSTTLRYGLPERSYVTLTILNTLGQEIVQLVNGEQTAGYYEVRFDGANLATGIYFYRLRAGDLMQTKKFVLLK